MLYTYSIVICACLTCADIYVKRQADEGSLTHFQALQSQEMPDMALSEILTALHLEFCTFACNEFSALSF